jgi:membrane-associated phospholipid phosphatase
MWWVDWLLPPGVCWPWAGWVVAAAGAVALGDAGRVWMRRGGPGRVAHWREASAAAQGPYRVISRPVAWGLLGLVAGAGLVTGDRWMLWAVGPGVWALAWVLDRQVVARPRVRWPQRAGDVADDYPWAWAWAGVWERVSVWVLVLGPWLIFYEAAMWRGTPAGWAHRLWEVRLGGEAAWPVWGWTWPVYASVYVLATLLPAIVPDRAGLARLAGTVGWAMLVAGVCYWVLPIAPTPRPMTVDHVLDAALWAEREHQRHTGAAAFPSFHVIWALLAAWGLARRWPRLRWPAIAWAWAVAAACVTTGQHAVVDVVAGGGVFVVLHHRQAVLGGIRKITRSPRPARAPLPGTAARAGTLPGKLPEAGRRRRAASRDTGPAGRAAGPGPTPA